MKRMLRKKRMQIIGLGVLALVTAILVIWSLPQIRNPQPSGVPAQVTPPATSAASEPSSADSTGGPTPTKASPSKGAAPKGLAGLAAMLRGKQPVSILVIGDGSGNESDEWVHLWATEHLAASRKVTYKTWDPNRSAWKSDGSTGTGATVTVWNASMTAPSLSTEHDRVAEVWQAADVVILSYGHRNPANSIGSKLTAIRKAIKAQDETANILVMIQNPDPVAIEQTQRETTQAVKKWAHDLDLDTVNIYDAFISDPAPRYELVEPDGSPSPIGSALWAKTFASLLASA